MATNYMIGVPYLQKEDLNNNGSLKNSNDVPSIVMIQGNFCGFCTKAKPAYQQFGKKYNNLRKNGKKVFNVYTAQSDDPDSKEAAGLISNIVKINGVPAFVGFDKTGKFVSVYNGERSVKGFEDFAKQLMAM